MENLSGYVLTKPQEDNVEIDLNPIINEVIADLETGINETGAIIKADSLPVISGSETLVRQLFFNLLSNCLKYRKAYTPPVIRITSTITDCVDLSNPNKKFHKISIRDNGKGLNNDDLKKLYPIFHEGKTDPMGAGSGMSLTVCKKIMSNHGGTIDAENNGKEGCSFFVFFPCIS